MLTPVKRSTGERDGSSKANMKNRKCGLLILTLSQVKDKEVLAKLPAFFRTLSGNKRSRAELGSLIKLLREG